MPHRWVEPFAAALALRHEPGLVLLESMRGFGHLGRRSFLAARPREVVTSGLDDVRATGGGWWVGWLTYDMGRQSERCAERSTTYALATSFRSTWRTGSRRRGAAILLLSMHGCGRRARPRSWRSPAWAASTSSRRLPSAFCAGEET